MGAVTHHDSRLIFLQTFMGAETHQDSQLIFFQTFMRTILESESLSDSTKVFFNVTGISKLDESLTQILIEFSMRFQAYGIPCG